MPRVPGHRAVDDVGRRELGGHPRYDGRSGARIMAGGAGRPSWSVSVAASSRAPLPTAAVRSEVADLLAAAVYRWVK
ncbi:hypothetical protein ABZ413_07935 [Nocardia rhamnosiphila]|uniref:hypothetical protein n=1 Tax=Nocardia rhamnosiphila TaxID=426716 RepID=UPI0033D3CDE7